MSDVRRTLVLLRHATAAPGAPDEQRHLTPEGIDEASAAGRWLMEQGLLADVVVCSPAARTRETWAAIQEETAHGVLITMEPAIYEADVDALLAVIAGLAESDAKAESVVVVGHAPGLPALAHDLCDGRGDDQDVAALTRSFVPGSLAVLVFDGGWADVRRGVADLVAVRPGGV